MGTCQLQLVVTVLIVVVLAAGARLIPPDFFLIILRHRHPRQFHQAPSQRVPTVIFRMQEYDLFPISIQAAPVAQR